MALLREDATLFAEAVLDAKDLIPEVYVRQDHKLLPLFMAEVHSSIKEEDSAWIWLDAYGTRIGEFSCVRKEGVWRVVLTQGLAMMRADVSLHDCMNNLRQLGTYIVMWCCKYGSDRDYPGPGIKLVLDLFSHPDPATALLRGGEGILLCKATYDENTAESVQKGDPHCTSYEITETKLSDAETAPDTPIVWDKQPVHDGKRNVLFFSGEVKLIPEGEFQALRERFAK